MNLRSKILLKAVTDYAIVIAAAPFWLAVVMVVAAVIKINEPGESVFFKQKRIGRFGRPFNCYKFRSMHKNWRKILERRFTARLLKISRSYPLRAALSLARSALLKILARFA